MITECEIRYRATFLSTYRDPMGSDHIGKPVEALTARLQYDLKTAMRDRDLSAVRAIRGLLTALANAQAVPIPDGLATPAVNPGNPVIGNRAEVARLQLTESDVRDVIFAEIARHDGLIEMYDDFGRHDEVAELTAERDVLNRYRP